MRNTSERAFTLVELLTVIAIIAILASMTAVVYPRVIERAKLASLENEFNQIRTEIVNVATKTTGSGGFPDGYGFLKRNYKEARVGVDSELFNLTPYTKAIKIHGTYALYDPFALDGYGSFISGEFGLLAYSPVTDTPAALFQGNWAGGQLNYASGATWVGFEADGDALSRVQRAFVYVPVNGAQAKIVSDYYKALWRKADSDKSDAGRRQAAFALVWPNTSVTDPNTGKDLSLAKSFASTLNAPFPPAKCDAFVLISIGPSGSTGGIIADPYVDPPLKTFMNDVAAMYPGSSTFTAPDGTTHTHSHVKMSLYRILALRAYFLATRDWNESPSDGPLGGNGKPDFDFRSRTKGEREDKVFELPNGTFGAGPVIYVFAG